MSDFKPGDVAMVKCADLGYRIAMRCGDGSWMTKDGKWGTAVTYDPRPLVVIDPEDREQAERLLEGYANWGPGELAEFSHYVDDMQAALRSLIAPPRPDEPTALGAVVEDVEGGKYIRTADVDCRKPWSYANNYSDFDWDDIQVIRILSDGVEVRP